MKTQLVILFFTFILVACGGDDSSQQAVEKQVAIDDSPPPLTNTSELVSNVDFSFTSSATLKVTLPVNPSGTIGYFINICADFSSENGIDKINFDSCKLRASLTPNEQNFTLRLSNAETRLIAQIWPLQDGAKPISQYFNIQETGNTWRITQP